MVLQSREASNMMRICLLILAYWASIVLMDAFVGSPFPQPNISLQTTEATSCRISFRIGNPPNVLRVAEGKRIEPAKVPNYRSKITGMKFVRIKAGKFQMGSTPEEIRSVNEQINDKIATLVIEDEQIHEVTITQDYLLGEYEVTRGQYRKFVEGSGYRTEGEVDGKGGKGWNAEKMASEVNAKYTWRDPGFPQTDEHPVVEVSWNDAVAFCNWQSRQDGLPESYRKVAGEWELVVKPLGYRLPTEAEWECACRAGSLARFSFGKNDEDLAKYGNVADASYNESTGRNKKWCIKADDGYGFTAPVGRFRANAWGLYDMHGNVWEWCGDCYCRYNVKSKNIDPFQSSEKAIAKRVLRGGCWSCLSWSCRSAFRARNSPVMRMSFYGFRVCLTAP